MRIVNLIHIGDEVKNLDEMTKEERREIAIKLNIQALTPLGYIMTKNTEKVPV